MSPATHIKICGLTRVEDAVRAVDLGADAIGVNLVPASRRRVTTDRARELCAAVEGRAQTVAVVADLGEEEIRRLVAVTQVDRVQLHGDESPALLEALAPLAYKAVRIAGPADIDRAYRYGGTPILLDAFVAGELGGTGHRFEWELARGIVSSRPVLLAGGLGPDNVAEAVERLGPWGVDVASGVELPGRPGVKDPDRVAAFIETVRRADSSGGVGRPAP